jgi:anthranilate phosphoribosyltransferase
VVLANAAMALHCTGAYKNYNAAYDAALIVLTVAKQPMHLRNYWLYNNKINGYYFA